MTSETPSQPRASPLYYASQFGLAQIVDWLSSKSPLSGYANIARILLYRGGSHRTQGPDGRTALYLASEKRSSGRFRVTA
ncbi:hypothetical protein B0F90DRAFT_1736184 [Multifurca ochricompacta]|uniref:Uncharacterized protein n=1 Tax=Multifurca ochricompacta TaxID=376703 RepID=A0AAD4M1R1_9AGAM|nr:hypothetical protein B0F90DRAFT_1736184 [Multifurca ochricompacta]